MTDTLKRLAGPTSPLKAEAGSTLYTPASNVTAALKRAILTNHDPILGAWAFVGINGMADHSKRVISNMYVAPGKTIIVPLDVPVSGVAPSADVVYGRQVVDMSYTNMVVGSAVAPIASTTDAATQATATWSSVAGTAYFMTIVATHANAAAAPTSITDTHTGLTWVKIHEKSNAALTVNISQWRGQVSVASGPVATTANFGITFTGCHIVIATVTGADVSGTNGDETFQTAGAFVGSTVTQTAILVPGLDMCGARLSALTSNAGSTSTPGAGFTEGTDNAIATPTNMLTTQYALTPGAMADYTLATTSTDKLYTLANVQDPSDALNITLVGVEVT